MFINDEQIYGREGEMNDMDVYHTQRMANIYRVSPRHAVY